VTRDLIVTLAVLGVVGQVLLVAFVVLLVLAALGHRGPLEGLRQLIYGYELWLAFLVAVTATAGSLFFSEIADFPPCKLCWFQRILMYPVAIVALLAALFDDRRAARYLLPFPVIGLAVAAYHMLVERDIVEETASCEISAPGGCGVLWVDELGYVTIPTLAGTGFALLIALLTLALLVPEGTRAEPSE
jgi:disulfide bond formation protein DsbB